MMHIKWYLNIVPYYDTTSWRSIGLIFDYTCVFLMTLQYYGTMKHIKGYHNVVPYYDTISWRSIELKLCILRIFGNIVIWWHHGAYKLVPSIVPYYDTTSWRSFGLIFDIYLHIFDDIAILWYHEAYQVIP